MKAIGVTWHDKFTEVFSNPSVLPLWSNRMRVFRKLLEETGLTKCCVEIVEPEKCSLKDLLLVHEEFYINKLVLASKSKTLTVLDYGDTYVYPGMVEDLLLLVGASIKLYNRMVEGYWKIAYQPYGGLHHARRDRASGFCPVNDVAIVVEKAKSRGVKRVAIVDIDVHHADGTQEIYWRDPQVLLISFHAYDPLKFYPGTGSEEELGEGKAYGTKLNLPLEPGSGDEVFLKAFKALVPEAIKLFKPELIIAQLGVDGHRFDSLGVLNLTTNSYLEVTSTLASLSKELNLPIMSFGGGGYGEWSAKCMIAEILGYIKALTKPPREVEDKVWRVIRESPTRDPPERVEKVQDKVEFLIRNMSGIACF